MISFKAKFIKYTNVQCLSNDRDYTNKKAAFVKLDMQSNSDMAAFNEIKKNWKTDNNILNDMYSDMDSICFDIAGKKQRQINNNRHFYALTAQKRGFSNLDSKKILGVSEFTDNNMKFGYIDFIQVNPKYIRRKNLYGEYRGIGEAMINAMIKLTKMKNIYLNSLPEIIDFYKKLGFIIVEHALKQPLMLFKK